MESTAERYSFFQISLLHLVPGIIITLVFSILARISEPLGWPASLALLITWPVAGLPLLLGILYYRGYKLNGTLSLKGILLYRQSIPFRQYAWLVPLLLVWTAIASTLLYLFAESLRQVFFSWWPTWLNLSVFAQNPTRYSSAVTWAVIFLSAILNIIVPITEELYFRSYLLPRIPFGRIWSPLWSAVLFSLYHFWLPWDFFGRGIALLPIVYAVQWKQNVYLSILVHCLLNSLGTIGLIVLVLNSGG